MNPYKTVSEMYGNDEDNRQPPQPNYTFDIKSNQALHDILDKFPIVVVDVWAAFCNPCKLLMPKYEKIAQKYAQYFKNGYIIFIKDNIEQNPDIHKPHVSVVPTFFIYVNKKRYQISDFREIDATVESALRDIIQEQKKLSSTSTTIDV